MALQKKFLKTKPVCKVRFSLTKEEAGDASSAFLVGEFNDWDTVSLPLKRDKHGGFFLELSLPLGGDYQFRYLLGNGEWRNDAEADAYVPCAFAGDDNSLVKV